jgi:phosphoglycolate phosphatase-like HAD superfamily hydrolase
MDVKMGLGARSHTVGVTWGVHPRSHLEEAGAHHIADTHVGDLPLIARRIFG